jgi:hypothetical protein
MLVKMIEILRYTTLSDSRNTKIVDDRKMLGVLAQADTP